MDLPPEIVSALAPFAPLFSDRAWAKAQPLAVGAILVIGRRTVAYLRTDEGFTPDRVLGLVVRRWSLEVTFEEARAHLGVETQRQWSDRAIASMTPVPFGLFSVVTLLASRWHGEGRLVADRAAWYAKNEPTFSDCLALCRQRIWRSRIRTGSGAAADSLQLPQPLLEALLHGLARAA